MYADLEHGAEIVTRKIIYIKRKRDTRHRTILKLIVLLFILRRKRNRKKTYGINLIK